MPKFKTLEDLFRAHDAHAEAERIRREITEERARIAAELDAERIQRQRQTQRAHDDRGYSES